MNTTVPPGQCLIHGSFVGTVCPSCSSAAPIQNQFAGYFAIIPSYQVTFTIPRNLDIPPKITTWTVGEPELDAFLRILRFNGITEFSVKPS